MKGVRLFAFGLRETGIYETIQISQVSLGLPIALLEQTIQETNLAAANWFMQQLQAM
jgi:hypothetical protein